MIYNLELEKQLLAALIKEPELFSEIANFIDHDDFYSEESNLHKTIFTIVKQSIQSGEEIDEVIIAQRISSIGLSFEDNLNPADYIKSLALRKVPKGNLIKTAFRLSSICFMWCRYRYYGSFCRISSSLDRCNASNNNRQYWAARSCLRWPHGNDWDYA